MEISKVDKAVTSGTPWRTHCNQKLQLNHDVLLYDWWNVIAKLEARIRASSSVKSIFRFGEYTLQVTSPVAHFDFAPNMLH